MVVVAGTGGVYTYDCSGHLQASLVWHGLVEDTHAGKGQGKQQGPGQLWVHLVATGTWLSSCTTVAVGLTTVHGIQGQ